MMGETPTVECPPERGPRTGLTRAILLAMSPESLGFAIKRCQAVARECDKHANDNRAFHKKWKATRRGAELCMSAISHLLADALEAQDMEDAEA